MCKANNHSIRSSTIAMPKIHIAMSYMYQVSNIYFNTLCEGGAGSVYFWGSGFSWNRIYLIVILIYWFHTRGLIIHTVRSATLTSCNFNFYGVYVCAVRCSLQNLMIHDTANLALDLECDIFGRVGCVMSRVLREFGFASLFRFIFIQF